MSKNLIKYNTIKHKQGLRNQGRRVCNYVPMFLINKNVHQLSKGTRILKIGQYLAELGKYWDLQKSPTVDQCSRP